MERIIYKVDTIKQNKIFLVCLSECHAKTKKNVYKDRQHHTCNKIIKIVFIIIL